MQGKSRMTFYLEADETGFSQMGEVRLALEDLKAKRSDCGTLLLTWKIWRTPTGKTTGSSTTSPWRSGSGCWWIPQWLQEDEKVKRPAQGRVPLILDPGLTFGTGSHATTRLCLTALERHIRGGERVLDLGCGSGILSIAALRLGARSARRWTSTTSAWTWPMKTPPSTASGRIPTPCGWGRPLRTAFCVRTRLGGGYPTSWWPTSWRT